MQLYYAANHNDAEAPWDMESEWVFTIRLEWQSWLFGLSRHGDSYSAVWTLCVGPMAVTYYRRKQ